MMVEAKSGSGLPYALATPTTPRNEAAMDIVSKYPKNIDKATPTRMEAPDVKLTIAHALYNEQQRVTDVVLSAAEANEWCRDVLTALALVYPNGSPWSDGEWRNTQGVDIYGYDHEGYHVKTGYNFMGVNRAGESDKSGLQWCVECRTTHPF